MHFSDSDLNGNGIAKVIDLCHAGDFDAAEDVHKTVKEIRYLFQDYAPIPAQKALLARGTGDNRWNNLRPPMMAMASEKVADLESTLKDKYSFTIGADIHLYKGLGYSLAICSSLELI